MAYSVLSVLQGVGAGLAAQHLMDQQVKVNWPRLLDDIAAQINPACARIAISAWTVWIARCKTDGGVEILLYQGLPGDAN